MLRCLFSVFIFLSPIILCAQKKAVAYFNSSAHNFETIKEIDGKVCHDFAFINKGEQPLIIRKVESTCGCMSPTWTKHPVLPGGKGFVRATFDPVNRPGNFDKTITVYTNAENPVQVLRIRGKVIPKKKTMLDDYPYELACGLRMVYDHISFFSIKENETKKIEIPVYNNHGKRLNVRFRGLPDFLKIKMIPGVLDAKAKGIIVAEYDAKIKNDIGIVKDQILIVGNGEEQGIIVSANIKQDFSTLTAEERELSPVITIDRRFVNFGNIEKNDAVDFVFRISNNGKSGLLIRKLYSFNPEVKFILPKEYISAGETVELKVVLDAGQLQGQQKILIELISNDPLNPEIKIRLSGFVN